MNTQKINLNIFAKLSTGESLEGKGKLTFKKMKQFHFSVLIGFTNFKFEVQLSFLKYFLQGGQICSRNFMLASKYLRANKNVG